MADFADIADWVGEALDSIDGVRGYADVPAQINPPRGGTVMLPVEIDVEFDATMARGLDVYVVMVRALASGDLRAAQKALASSISKVKDELDGDLDGKVDYARVTRIRGDTWGQITVANATFTIIDFEIEIGAGG